MKNEDIQKISKTFNISEEDIKKTLEREAAKIKKPEYKIDQKIANSKNFLFLPEDLAKLDEKIKKIRFEINRLGKAIGKSCDISGETFHDNFDYEECGRQQSMWLEEMRKLTNIRQKSKIVLPKKNANSVSIGQRVVIENNGKKMEIRVGSYLTFSRDSFSYLSPIISLITGAKSGESRTGLINGVKTIVKILEIKGC